MAANIIPEKSGPKRRHNHNGSIHKPSRAQGIRRSLMVLGLGLAAGR
jgi:hypothetical protein